MIKLYGITDSKGVYFNVEGTPEEMYLIECEENNGIMYVSFIQAREEVEWINTKYREGKIKSNHLTMPVIVKEIK